MFTADGGAALTGGLNWYRANTFHPPAGTITAPTLYVWSTGDVALGREAAEGTAAEVAGPYRFEVLDGVSHWIPEVAADELNALLLEHLRRTELTLDWTPARTRAEHPLSVTPPS